MPETNNQSLQQRSFSEINITTNTLSMFDDASVQLRIAGFQDSVQIAWWLPNRSEGKVTYPVDNRYSVVLAPERVTALDALLRMHVIPAYQRGNVIERGVFTNRGNTNMILIKIEEDGNIYAYLHKDINTDKIPKESYRFHFTAVPYLSMYNPSTGENQCEEFLASFCMFCNCIHAFATIGVSGASAHAERYHGRFQSKQVMDHLTNMAAKLGVSVDTFQRSGGVRDRKNSRGGYSNNSYPAAQTPIQDTTDMNTLIY